MRYADLGMSPTGLPNFPIAPVASICSSVRDERVEHKVEDADPVGGDLEQYLWVFWQRPGVADLALRGSSESCLRESPAEACLPHCFWNRRWHGSFLLCEWLYRECGGESLCCCSDFKRFFFCGASIQLWIREHAEHIFRQRTERLHEVCISLRFFLNHLD